MLGVWGLSLACGVGMVLGLVGQVGCPWCRVGACYFLHGNVLRPRGPPPLGVFSWFLFILTLALLTFYEEEEVFINIHHVPTQITPFCTSNGSLQWSPKVLGDQNKVQEVFLFSFFFPYPNSQKLYRFGEPRIKSIELLLPHVMQWLLETCAKVDVAWNSNKKKV